LVSVGALVKALNIPPPACEAELLMKVTLLSAGALKPLYMPPPRVEAELPMKMTLLSAGALEASYRPAPLEAKLTSKIRLLSVGELELLNMPPPRSWAKLLLLLPLALPAAMVKPSRTALAPKPVLVTTW